MSEYIGIYASNPTAGEMDGTLLSEDGTFAAPLTFTLNATENETAARKLAVRCGEGYEVDGDVTVKAHFLNNGQYLEEGGNIDKYSFCTDNGYASEAEALEKGNWKPSLQISGVEDKNVVFWMRCTSSSAEKPSTDKSVSLHAEGMIRVAE